MNLLLKSSSCVGFLVDARFMSCSSMPNYLLLPILFDKCSLLELPRVGSCIANIITLILLVSLLITRSISSDSLDMESSKLWWEDC